MGCEFDGKVEANDTVGVVPETEIFKSLGKSDTGYLLFRCPSCGQIVEVDPLKTFLSRKMKGYPVNKEETIWEYFEGKNNTDQVIIEKAINIASFIISSVIGIMDGTCESLQEKRNIKIDKVAYIHAIIETLMFSIHVVTTAASEFIEEGKRNIFLNALLLTIREHSPKDLQIESGKAEKFRALLDVICANRLQEYGKHECKELEPDEAWGEKDTLYREFGGNIAGSLGLEVDLATDNNIQSLYACAHAPVMFSRKLLSLGFSPTSNKTEKDAEIGFSQRILCSDGNCIGVINEQGVCNTCGKPYRKEV
jgi:hypothetical protein